MKKVNFFHSCYRFITFKNIPILNKPIPILNKPIPILNKPIPKWNRKT